MQADKGLAQSREAKNPRENSDGDDSRSLKNEAPDIEQMMPSMLLGLKRCPEATARPF